MIEKTLSDIAAVMLMSGRLAEVEAFGAGCIYTDRSDAAPGLDVMRYPLSRLRDVIAAALRKRARS